MEDYRIAMNRNENAIKIMYELNNELKRLKKDNIEDEIRQKIKTLDIRTRVIEKRIEYKRNEINLLL